MQVGAHTLSAVGHRPGHAIAAVRPLSRAACEPQQQGKWAEDGHTTFAQAESAQSLLADELRRRELAQNAVLHEVLAEATLPRVAEAARLRYRAQFAQLQLAVGGEGGGGGGGAELLDARATWGFLCTSGVEAAWLKRICGTPVLTTEECESLRRPLCC